MVPGVRAAEGDVLFLKHSFKRWRCFIWSLTAKGGNDPPSPSEKKATYFDTTCRYVLFDLVLLTSTTVQWASPQPPCGLMWKKKSIKGGLLCLVRYDQWLMVSRVNKVSQLPINPSLLLSFSFFSTTLCSTILHYPITDICHSGILFFWRIASLEQLSWTWNHRGCLRTQKQSFASHHVFFLQMCLMHSAGTLWERMVCDCRLECLFILWSFEIISPSRQGEIFCAFQKHLRGLF